MKDLKIWVIDDDDIHQYVMKSTLEDFAVVSEVVGFLDPVEALDALEQDIYNKPDLILLDLNMPGMDGREFLEEFVGLQKRISFSPEIWVVSSSTLEQDRTFAEMHESVSKYLSKPLDMDKLESYFLSATK